MLEVEEYFNENIEELLRRKFVDEDKSVYEIRTELSCFSDTTISYRIIIDWLNKAGIYSRRLKI